MATVNLLYTNSNTATIADDLLGRDIDVIAFTEFTAEHRNVLSGHPLADRFAYRIDREGPRARGVAVWSRIALDVWPPPSTVNHSIDVTVIAGDATFRLLAAHTPTPFDDLEGWIDDLDAIRNSASKSGEPTIVIGDLNATCWHPAIRAMRRRGTKVTAFSADVTRRRDVRSVVDQIADDGVPAASRLEAHGDYDDASELAEFTRHLITGVFDRHDGDFEFVSR